MLLLLVACNPPSTGGPSRTEPESSTIGEADESSTIGEADESSTIGEADEAKVVRAYFAAESWEERLNYCWNKENIRSAMRKRYKNVDLSAVRDLGNIEVRESTDLRYKRHGICIAKAENIERAYFIRRTPDGPLIDWEASLTISDVNINLLKTERIQEAVMLRCFIQKDNYFNFNYRGLESVYDNYKIAVDVPLMVAAYVEKHSDAGRALSRIALESPGEWLPVMIKVATGPMDRVGKSITIVDFVQGGHVEGIDLSKL